MLPEVHGLHDASGELAGWLWAADSNVVVFYGPYENRYKRSGVDLSRGGTFVGLLRMPKQSPPSLQRPGGLFLQADDVRF